jgi:Uma2 family endonuclease
MTQVEKAITLEEFLKLPETEPASEYLDGQVVQKVTPKKKHSWLQAFLAGRINNYSEPKRHGAALTELRCTFEGRSLVFDIAYFDWSRIRFEDTGEPEDETFDPPDWIIEILSPGQTVTNMTRRCAWCVKNGVRLAWLVEPRRKQVQVFRPNRKAETLEGEALLDASEVLGSFRLHVNDVFDLLRPGRVL